MFLSQLGRTSRAPPQSSLTSATTPPAKHAMNSSPLSSCRDPQAALKSSVEMPLDRDLLVTCYEPTPFKTAWREGRGGRGEGRSEAYPCRPRAGEAARERPGKLRNPLVPAQASAHARTDLRPRPAANKRERRIDKKSAHENGAIERQVPQCGEHTAKPNIGVWTPIQAIPCHQNLLFSVGLAGTGAQFCTQ